MACGDGGVPPLKEGEMEVTTPNWSRLQGDLVGAVAQKITAIDDYVRFRAVCKPWRAAAPARPRHLPTQFPWLMFPYQTEADRTRVQSTHIPLPPMGTMAFFSVANRKSISLPGVAKVRFCGSSHRWLLMGEENCPKVSLLNPITGVTIPLPSLSSFPLVVFTGHTITGEPIRRIAYERFIWKIALSSDPAVDRDALVMASHGQSSSLAFCRIGDDSWTWIDPPQGITRPDMVDDVTYHRGRFYVILSTGGVGVCDLSHPTSCKLLGVTAHRSHSDADVFSRYHLVESTDGDLLLIARYKSDSGPFSPSLSTRFEVFKLELDGQPKVSKLKSIGNNMLFLSPRGSFAISAVGFPGFQGNCIYFADSNGVPHCVSDVWRLDICLFKLRGRKKEVMHSYLCRSSFGWQWPLWFTPSLCQ